MADLGPTHSELGPHSAMSGHDGGPYTAAEVNSVDSLNPLLPASWNSERFAKVCLVVTRESYPDSAARKIPKTFTPQHLCYLFV